jgi:hypothetical protein
LKAVAIGWTTMSPKIEAIILLQKGLSNGGNEGLECPSACLVIFLFDFCENFRNSASCLLQFGKHFFKIYLRPKP